MAEPLVSGELKKAYIGKESTPRTEKVEWSPWRAYAVALRFPEPPNPLYVDREYAQRTRRGDRIAPPTFCYATCRPWTEEERAGEVQVPITGKTGLNMGVEMEFLAPVRLGDVLTMRQRVADIQERSSPRNRMVVIVREQTYTDQDGKTKAIVRRFSGQMFDPAPE